MRAMFVLPFVLLVAAANAEVFKFVHQDGASTLYDIRGALTIGSQKLTGEKAALEYNGTIAFQKIEGETYHAMFNTFTLGKYDHVHRDIEDDGFGLQPGEERFVEFLHEQGVYEHEMKKPVRVIMKNGQVERLEADKEHKQWSLNIYRAVFTLLQNQAQKPSTLEIPHIESKYEGGVGGNCRVQYEILSLPQDGTVPEVYNITKTKNYKDCKEARPVYLHLKDSKRGCAGVCNEHTPENFLDNYEEENTDYKMRPTPGCPANHLRTDTIVTVHKISKYNVSRGLLDEARTDSMDIYRLFRGEMEVRTRLDLVYQGTGPQVQGPQNVRTYKNLRYHLPADEEKLDIPIYALMKAQEKYTEYPLYFMKHFEAVVQKLVQLKEPKHTQEPSVVPTYIIELVQALSAMNPEEIKRTMPAVVGQQQPKNLGQQEQLQRQLWIEILGKAGSKSAVKVAVDLIKKGTFTPTEIRRVLQDIGSFQSYPDTEMIEDVLGLCTEEHQFTSTGKATACVAAGKIISKACRSQVTYPPYTQKQHYHGQYTQPQSQSQQPHEEELTMGRLAIKPELRCTVEKLQKYIQKMSRTLQTATEFKQVVAYINGLAKIAKPEVLPELIGYVNGTAQNLHQIKEQGEDQDEAIEFIRKVAIISLRSIASTFPKEVNPIVRVIFLNVTEDVQTRILAFDTWMTTQPAQWEVEKIMQVANFDSSVELTHYVYTALKNAMFAKEPCHQILAKRVRDAWTQLEKFDYGPEYSHVRSKAFYDNIRDYGLRATWKMVASNTTILPTYTEGRFQQVRGPFSKIMAQAKLLVKGGDKIWEELVGKDGFLERISKALDGQVQKGERQQQTEQLLKDLASGLHQQNLDENTETPKALLIWSLFSGEAVIPIDREYITELKHELLQTLTKVGKEGVTGHFVRVLMPTKAFHVEPSAIGFPIVHSTLHPIVISVRYENLKLKFNNIEDRVVPELVELTGTVEPTILSLRESRVFLGDVEGKRTPTMMVTNIKEGKLHTTFRLTYNHEERRFKLNVKPHFDRVYHSSHCTRMTLRKNIIVDENTDPNTHFHGYGECIRTMNTPIYLKKEIGGRLAGMTLKINGTSHKPWSGLSIFKSAKDLKHQVVSLYLEADKQNPINEWAMTIDMDSNVEQLVKIPLAEQVQKIHKIPVQYKPRREEQLSSELQSVMQKVQQLLQKHQDKIEETTVEKQMLVKIEGRHQGQPKKVFMGAMKRIFNFERTEQQIAMALQSKQSNKGIEIFGNVSYPKISSPFHFEPLFIAEDELLNGTLSVKLLGQTEELYHIDFNATKTEEQRENFSPKWYETRCLAEQKSAKTLTDACRKAILQHNSLDRMEMSIKLPKNVSPNMKQAAKKLLTLIKYKYYPQMQSDITGRQHIQRQEDREINISANTTRVSPWSLLYNVRVEMPRENITLSNIRVRGAYPPHMQLTMKQQLKHKMYRGQKGTPCVLGEQAVRTYDNVTFGLDVRPQCEYVLTRDCQGTPDFTVTFVVVEPSTNGKKIRTQLVNTFIELHPFGASDRHFTVVVNGTEYQVTYDKPLVFHYAAGKKAFVHVHETSNTHHTPIVHIYTESKEFFLAFDGYTSEVYVDQKYKGTTCGVCGNKDNEQDHEFIGPNGKEYYHSNEFIASYGLTEDCRVPVENTRERRMDELYKELEKNRREQQQHRNNSPRRWNWDSSEERGTFDEEAYEAEEVYAYKTHIQQKDNVICFSLKPVRVCKHGYRKDGVAENLQIESICLDKNNPLARKAWRMAARSSNAVVDTPSLNSQKVSVLTSILSVPKCKRDF